MNDRPASLVKLLTYYLFEYRTQVAW